ncbi:MAG: cation-translocating P-type ATPase [Eubacteriales bacterium]|nr:cation-translocating P-type ATPase [Eubacteriales bacterium]
MDWYRIAGQTVLEAMHGSRSGLPAVQAEELLEKCGENVLEEGERKKAWQVFLEQFQDLLVIILIVAAVISMASGQVESTVVIFAVILLNAVLGTVQHEKAQKSLDSLKALSAPVARVMRDGRQTEVSSAQVVPGDLVLLEAGELVVADGRLLECANLQVDESSLTGESAHVEKQVEALGGEGAIPLAERSNMVFSGSLVTGGRGTMVVTATGMETEIGRIASLMNATREKKTPLQVSLDQFSSRLAAVIMLICGLVFGLSLYRRMPVLDSLMFAVALAVAAIPEALGSIVTIVQAMGTQRMAREHAIIKDLKAVESLGCVSVICSDKTGTLTQNRMSVQQVYVDGGVVFPCDLDVGYPVHRHLMYASVLDNDAAVSGRGALVPDCDAAVSGRGVLVPDCDASVPGRVALASEYASPSRIGDPTELALLEMWSGAGIHPEIVRQKYPRLGELPFDSRRKLMSTWNRISGETVMLTKGAPDVVLERSDTVLTSDGVRPMTGGWRQRIQKQNESWSRDGLRVIAMACRMPERGGAGDPDGMSGQGSVGDSGGMREQSDSGNRCGLESRDVSPEEHLTFLGMAAMMDPPRLESKPAVLAARRAGIRPVMITGDHPVTAVAVAERIGLRQPGDCCVTGSQLDAMTEQELGQKLPQISVYARVSPEHKIRIVEAWQKRGHIVAMTGDGVNDAPALKKADIGVAMGMTGTEVSKDAAAMILMDDNFATIIKAVANGRNVYRNIRHAIQFLLSGNMAGILSVLYTSLLALPVPFAPVHLLFINLLTDSLPAIAIGMEPQEEGLLDQPPRDPQEGILTGAFLWSILLQGGLIAVCTMLAYHTGLAAGAGSVAWQQLAAGTMPGQIHAAAANSSVASTMAFATLTLARLLHGFNCRSDHSIIRLGISSNLWSVMAFEAGVVLLAGVLFLPGLQELFAVADLSLRQLLTILTFAALPTLIIQAVKTVAEALK